jgi:hypothetical protein
MSGTVFPSGPIPGFPGIGPIGGVYIIGSGAGAGSLTIGADGSQWVGGYVMISILAELRVHSQLLQILANDYSNQLSQLRADAIADMGTLYQTNAVAPIPSS